jgi:hypothetical protein
VTLLRRSGRGKHPVLVEQILADLHHSRCGNQLASRTTYGSTVGGLSPL